MDPAGPFTLCIPTTITFTQHLNIVSCWPRENIVDSVEYGEEGSLITLCIGAEPWFVSHTNIATFRNLPYSTVSVSMQDLCINHHSQHGTTPVSPFTSASIYQCKSDSRLRDSMGISRKMSGLSPFRILSRQSDWSRDQADWRESASGNRRNVNCSRKMKISVEAHSPREVDCLYD